MWKRKHHSRQDPHLHEPHATQVPTTLSGALSLPIRSVPSKGHTGHQHRGQLDVPELSTPNPCGPGASVLELRPGQPLQPWLQCIRPTHLPGGSDSQPPAGNPLAVSPTPTQPAPGLRPCCNGPSRLLPVSGDSALLQASRPLHCSGEGFPGLRHIPRPAASPRPLPWAPWAAHHTETPPGRRMLHPSTSAGSCACPARPGRKPTSSPE